MKTEKTTQVYACNFEVLFDRLASKEATDILAVGLQSAAIDEIRRAADEISTPPLTFEMASQVVTAHNYRIGVPE